MRLPLVSLALWATTALASTPGLSSNRAAKSNSIPDGTCRFNMRRRSHNNLRRLPSFPRRRGLNEQQLREQREQVQQEKLASDSRHTSFSTTSHSNFWNATATASAPAAEGTAWAAANTSALFKELSYAVDLAFGTGSDAQFVTLDFDTGSCQTWVDPDCSQYTWRPSYLALCRSTGFYLPDASSTSHNASLRNDEISYGSGYVFVRYYNDNVTLVGTSNDEYQEYPSSVVLSPLTFGVALESNGLTSGILGMAPGRGYNMNYSSVLDTMYEQKYIQDLDFSVALGSVDEDNGEVMFGGIDTSKFTGPLLGFPISDQMPDDDFWRYWINMTYIGITEPQTCESVPFTPPTFDQRALLDTGTTLTFFPSAVMKGFMRAFPEATMHPEVGAYEVFCSNLDQDGTIDIGFGGNAKTGEQAITIHIPYKDFLWRMPAIPELGNRELCFLGAMEAEEGFNVLGDTFLRSVYLLFRQQQQMIYLAQWADCGTNYVSSHDADLDDLNGDCEPPAPKTTDPWDYCYSITTASYSTSKSSHTHTSKATSTDTYTSSEITDTEATATPTDTYWPSSTTEATTTSGSLESYFAQVTPAAYANQDQQVNGQEEEFGDSLLHRRRIDLGDPDLAEHKPSRISITSPITSRPVSSISKKPCKTSTHTLLTATGLSSLSASILPEPSTSSSHHPSTADQYTISDVESATIIIFRTDTTQTIADGTLLTGKPTSVKSTPTDTFLPDSSSNSAVNDSTLQAGASPTADGMVMPLLGPPPESHLHAGRGTRKHSGEMVQRSQCATNKCYAALNAMENEEAVHLCEGVMSATTGLRWVMMQAKGETRPEGCKGASVTVVKRGCRCFFAGRDGL